MIWKPSLGNCCAETWTYCMLCYSVVLADWYSAGSGNKNQIQTCSLLLILFILLLLSLQPHAHSHLLFLFPFFSLFPLRLKPSAPSNAQTCSLRLTRFLLLMWNHPPHRLPPSSCFLNLLHSFFHLVILDSSSSYRHKHLHPLYSQPSPSSPSHLHVFPLLIRKATLLFTPSCSSPNLTQCNVGERAPPPRSALVVWV